MLKPQGQVIVARWVKAHAFNKQNLDAWYTDAEMAHFCKENWEDTVIEMSARLTISGYPERLKLNNELFEAQS